MTQGFTSGGAGPHKTTHQDGGSDEISIQGLSGLLADDQHVLDAEVLAVAAALVHTHSGYAIQEVSTQTGELDSTGTAIPTDDTIPQNTEGKEAFTRTITPHSASNMLKIHVVFMGATDGLNAALVCALFQDSIANALAAGWSVGTAANFPQTISFTHHVAAGTTSQITFKIRFGPNTGNAYMNGNATGRFMGSVMSTSITVTEFAA